MTGRRRCGWAAAVWVAAVTAGCEPNDLGAPCHLLRGDGTEEEPRPGHTTVFSGSGECADFACVSWDGAGATCTRSCALEGDACPGGWTCRSAVLTPDQLAETRQRLEGTDADDDGVDDFDEFAAGLSESLYCGPEP